MSFEFSPSQAAEIESVQQWIDRPTSQVYRFGGAAGVGKSTCASAAVARAPGRVLYFAPTAKAALVLRRKGCATAETVHAGIYIPKGEKLSERVEAARREVVRIDERIRSGEAAGGELAALRERQRDIRKLLAAAKDEARPMFTLDPAAELGEIDVWGALVDEASMVGSRMARDLTSFKKPILALGDPFQLQPVRDEDWFGSGKMDSLLTEIHRQAADSGILRLSQVVRRGEPIEFGMYGDDARIVSSSRTTTSDKEEFVMGADQIIVGRNDTRRKVNRWVRKLRGRSTNPFPVEGDRVVCLRNNYDAGVMNGSVWTVTAASTDEDAMVTTMTLADPDTGDLVGVDCWAHHFLGREEEIPHYEIDDRCQFDYGYAITAHKSQGSEWNNVLVIDESQRMHAGTDPRRHLYTAVTRAAKQLVVIR